jgi:hypothetical protein
MFVRKGRMKIQRIDLASWNALRTLVFKAGLRLGVPRPLLDYLRERILDRPDAGWRPYDNGWRNSEYSDWDKRVTDFVKRVPVAEKASIAVAAIMASARFEIESQTGASTLNCEIKEFFASLQGDQSPFGLMSVRNDALGETLHAMALFVNTLLRSRIELSPPLIGDVAKVVIEVAQFRTANRLEPEYFPFSPVLQQLKKQSVSGLSENSAVLEQLLGCVNSLPFDSGESRRMRLALQKLAAELVTLAKGTPA